MATEQVTLKAEKRARTGKGAARKLRASGRVPAVIYGHAAETESLSLDAREAEQLFRSISVENTIVDLAIEDGEEVRTLIREVQVHPYRPELIHVDFYRIQEGVKLEVQIPVHLVGMAAGVKHSGGVLEQIIHDLPVRCIPAKIPESFEIDVTELGMHESVHVSDLELEEGVEALLDPERTICTVVAPKIVLEEPEEDEEEEVELELLDAELEEGEVPEGEEAEEEGPGEED